MTLQWPSDCLKLRGNKVVVTLEAKVRTQLWSWLSDGPATVVVEDPQKGPDSAQAQQRSLEEEKKAWSLLGNALLDFVGPSVPTRVKTNYQRSFSELKTKGAWPRQCRYDGWWQDETDVAKVSIIIVYKGNLTINLDDSLPALSRLFPSNIESIHRCSRARCSPLLMESPVTSWIGASRSRSCTRNSGTGLPR